MLGKFALYFMAIFICLGSLTRAASAQDSNKTVVVLYDKTQEASVVSLLDKQIEHSLDRLLDHRVKIYREDSDFAQESGQYNQIFIDYLSSRYSKDKPDLIIAVEAKIHFVSLLEYGDKLFPGVSIVSSDMDPQQVKSMGLSPTITGVSLHINFWPTIVLAQKLQPGLQHVVVVAGNRTERSSPVSCGTKRTSKP